MKKIVLVDGNNLLFRSYYATLYTGNIMRNKDGFPTNGVYGFVNMINKIVNDEKPEYMMVAFDIGKTFRHEKYERYKDGRKETPDDLKVQFPIAKKILAAMGIKYLECAGYEADDIIGTVSMWCEKDPEYEALIVSSDKDLLQLISDETTVKLLKTKDYIMMDRKTFNETYGFEPIHMIDLKALMGDASDNIPGVRGIGEKGAIKLVSEYKTIDNIYENIDKISGKTKEKLIDGKNDAYISYELATIVTNVPIEISIDDIKYKGNQAGLNDLYEELEFYSFLKKDKVEKEITKPFDVKIIKNIDEINVEGDCAVYLEILGTNYHNSKILGMGVYNENSSIYIPLEILKQQPDFLLKNNKYTYDIKKTYVSFKWNNINIDNINYDAMIAGYLLDYNVKDDIAYLANQFDYDIPFYENIYGKNNKLSEPNNVDIIAYNSVLKAKFIYETYNIFNEKLNNENMIELFNDIEIPLSYTLGDMEYNGVYVDKEILNQMGIEIKNKIFEVEKNIYEIVGHEFNISSPQQLGTVLFEELNLPTKKKGKTGYSTAADVLNKLVDKHPIINMIIHIIIFSDNSFLRQSA